MSGAVGVVAFASIGGILFGLDQGNWGGAISKRPFIDAFCHNPENWDNISEPNCSPDASASPQDYILFLQLASALLQLGAAIGALFVAPTLAGKLGRRETMFVGALVTIAGVIPLIFFTQRTIFLIFRVVAGFGVGMVTYALPMFISEVAPPAIRGVLGSMMQLTVVSGVLVASLLNLMDGFKYQISFSLPTYPAAILAMGIFFFPMSPRFALLKYMRLDKLEEGVTKAKASLMRLRGDEATVDLEIEDLQKALDEESEEASWRTLWVDKSIFRRLLIANLLQWGQQFTGVNAILSYGPTIFHDAGVPIDPLVSAAIVNACMLVSTIFAMIVIDMWGRRLLLLAGGSLMCVSMGIAAILSKIISDKEADNPEADTLALGYGVLVSVCFYAFGFGPWGIIPWVYPSEIFPMDVKEKALSTSVGSQWLANFLIAFLVPGQVAGWGSWGTLAFYSICTVFILIWIVFCVPEIKGVRIEEMDAIFGPRTTTKSCLLASRATS